MPISEEEARAAHEGKGDEGFMSELERTIAMFFGEDSGHALMASAAVLSLVTLY